MSKAAEERLANDPTSELWGEHRSRYRFASQRVAGQRVLDIACGAGFGLEMLMAAGARAVGIDLDLLSLAEAHQLAPRAHLVCADGSRLPLPGASFDLITSFETIEHVQDAAALVQELRRVLRPGGRLVLSTPNRAFGPPARHTSNPFHVREFTADELRQLLGAAFAEVGVYGQYPLPSYHYVPFLLVAPRYEPSALAWKVLNRLPYGLKDTLARLLSGRPFYPDETGYRFMPGRFDGAHALLAVAQ